MNSKTAATRIKSMLYINSNLIREERLNLQKHLKDDEWKCHFQIATVTGGGRDYVRIHLFRIPGDYDDAIIFEAVNGVVEIIQLGNYGHYHNHLQIRLNAWLNEREKDGKEPSAMIRRRVSIIDRLNYIWKNMADPNQIMNGALHVRSRIDLNHLVSKFDDGSWEMKLYKDSKYTPRIFLRNTETSDLYQFRIIRDKAVPMIKFRYVKDCKKVTYNLNQWLYHGSIKIDTNYNHLEAGVKNGKK